MGAFSVVLETLVSGKTELPFSTFVLLMQPIHLAIGIVEGLVTAAVAGFVWKARPEIIKKASLGEALGSVSIKKVLTGFAVVALFTGCVLSWFTSSHPDGLEWSMFRTAGVEELEATDRIHETLGEVQQKTAFMPDYGFKNPESEGKINATHEKAEVWPAVSMGSSTAGVIGGLMTLVFAGMIGAGISMAKRRGKTDTA
jgi:cobalt/nickel transport system permease protein